MGELYNQKGYLINEYIKKLMEQEKTLDEKKIQISRLTVGGEDLKLRVWRIPIEYLTFRAENGRIAVEKLALEREKEIEIDGINPKNNKLFSQLLLPCGEKSDLYAELREHKQKDPAVITCDGVLVDGNRRKATYLLLQEKFPNEFKYMDVVILPDYTTEQEIFELEISLQKKRDFKEDYTTIADLLSIKRAEKFYTTDEQMAKALRYKNVSEFNVARETLRTMDEFLESIGESQNYTKVKSVKDVFRTINGEEKKLVDRRVKAQKIYKARQLFFKALESKIAKREKTLETENKINRDDYRDMSIAFLNDDIYEIIPDDLENKSTEEVNDIFEYARRLVDIEVAKDKPIQLLKNALMNIKKIKPKSKSIKSPEFQHELDTLIELVINLKQ